MKKLFVVVVTDFGNGVLEFPEVFHIKADGPHSAVRCARDMFKEDFSFGEDTIEEDLDFFAYELKDKDIIEA